VPRVSIGLPVYNGERFIRHAIQSLLDQTFGDFELLIADNASTDGTAEICREFVERDRRVRYRRNARNLGAGPNYNLVFAWARGRYFKWAAHDDVCAPTFIEQCVDVLDRDASVVLCHPSTSIIDEDGAVVAHCHERFHLMEPGPADRLLGCFRAGSWVFHPIFGVTRRAALASTSLIGTYNGSDFVLLAHLALAGKCHQLSERLFLRREHPARCGRMSPAVIAQWWTTGTDVSAHFRHWRRLLDYVCAVRGSGATATVPERLRCLAHIVRWSVWHRTHLAADITEFVRFAATAMTSASAQRADTWSSANVPASRGPVSGLLVGGHPACDAECAAGRRPAAQRTASMSRAER
jgi:glycosyltransferase involved in cell wall biosynthesis